MSRVLLDTSVFVALEWGRPLDGERLGVEWAVSVVTVADLRAGVLAAPDVPTRAKRLTTLSRLSTIVPLPIDLEVAQHWAELRVLLRDAGRRVRVNDLWIAATARTHALAVATQEEGYDVLADVAGLSVIRV